jgi:hypothetical protein
VADATPPDGEGLPPVAAIVGLVVVLALLATAVIALCFVVAKLATGSAY